VALSIIAAIHIQFEWRLDRCNLFIKFERYSLDYYFFCFVTLKRIMIDDFIFGFLRGRIPIFLERYSIQLMIFIFQYHLNAFV